MSDKRFYYLNHHSEILSKLRAGITNFQGRTFTAIAKLIVPNMSFKCNDGMLRKDISYLNTLHNLNLLESSTDNSNNNNSNSTNESYEQELSDNNLKIVSVSKRIKTFEELVKDRNIDLDKWKLKKCTVGNWEVTLKVGEGDSAKPVIVPMVKISADFMPNEIGIDKKALIEEMKKYAPKYPKIKYQKSKEKDCVLEICPFDLHFGKQAWREETGEDYDMKIAVDRYEKCIDHFISEAPWERIEQIVLPTGNDLFNIDNNLKQTTAGTPQDNDSRVPKMFSLGRLSIIKSIDRLSAYAPITVKMVRGNHDSLLVFMLGEVLEAWYRNNPNVTIDNKPASRKYFRYGKTLIMYTHGDKEKPNDLGLLCATECKQDWAETEYRYAHLGHIHSSKQIKYVTLQTNMMFEVEYMPSMSGTDVWHSEKGYLSNNQAKAFLHHREKGKLQMFEYNHK